jgi:hypothetical protein
VLPEFSPGFWLFDRWLVGLGWFIGLQGQCRQNSVLDFGFLNVGWLVWVGLLVCRDSVARIQSWILAF